MTISLLMAHHCIAELVLPISYVRQPWLDKTHNLCSRMAEYIILIVYCNQLLHYTSIIQYYNKGLAQVGQTGPIPAPILGYTAKRWWQWWWERQGGSNQGRMVCKCGSLCKCCTVPGKKAHDASGSNGLNNAVEPEPEQE